MLAAFTATWLLWSIQLAWVLFGRKFRSPGSTHNTKPKFNADILTDFRSSFVAEPHPFGQETSFSGQTAACFSISSSRTTSWQLSQGTRRAEHFLLWWSSASLGHTSSPQPLLHSTAVNWQRFLWSCQMAKRHLNFFFEVDCSHSCSAKNSARGKSSLGKLQTLSFSWAYLLAFNWY